MRGLAAPPVAPAAATYYSPLFRGREQAGGGLTEQLSRCLPVEGVEAPLPAPLLVHQSRVPELLHVVGDLRLTHREGFLELADADALFPLFDRDAGVGEVAAATAVGHHGEHPHPYGIGEGAAQGDEPLHRLPGGVLADAVLLNEPEIPGAYAVLPAGLRPRMKALASGTSAEAVVAAVVAVSPQHPEPPQHPEASDPVASANSSS